MPPKRGLLIASQRRAFGLTDQNPKTAPLSAPTLDKHRLPTCDVAAGAADSQLGVSTCLQGIGGQGSGRDLEAGALAARENDAECMWWYANATCKVFDDQFHQMAERPGRSRTSLHAIFQVIPQ